MSEQNTSSDPPTFFFQRHYLSTILVGVLFGVLGSVLAGLKIGVQLGQVPAWVYDRIITIGNTYLQPFLFAEHVYVAVYVILLTASIWCLFVGLFWRNIEN